MGLLSRLFGKSDSAAGGDKARLIDRVRETTAGEFAGDESLTQLFSCFETPDDYDLKLEALNKLYELERVPWADAFATRLAADRNCPPVIVKGIVKHFLAENRLDEVADGARRFLSKHPSEGDLVVAVAKWFAGRKDWRTCLEIVQPALAHDPDAMRLYALAGECHAREKRWEDAANHLRPACEMFEQAFRRHQIPADSLHSEQLEFSRLYSLLEDAARRCHGEEGVAAAFENIHMTPSGFGLQKEAEHLATTRVEYKPRRTSIAPLEELSSLAEEVGRTREQEAEMRYLLGSRELRQQRYDEAMRHFREALELDIENFGAYFGWAACNTLTTIDPLPNSDDQDSTVAPPTTMAYEKIVTVWDSMTLHEKRLVKAATKPVERWLQTLADAGAKLRVHPLDMRLRDIFPVPVELRFEDDGRPPQALPAFAAKREAHIRIDEFLTVTPQQFTTARLVGYLLADAWRDAEKRKISEAERVLGSLAKKLPAERMRTLASVDDLLADMVEAVALDEIFPGDRTDFRQLLIEKAPVLLE